MGSWERTEDEKKMCAALEVVAKQVKAKHITAGKIHPFISSRLSTDRRLIVAIAYTMHKAPFVYPIIGGRKVEHLMANIEALDITLTAEQIAYIDGILPFDKGFPSNFLVCFVFKSETIH
jgi:aryl-alcohol dehydrogenase-like predicted oxidoreductase